MAGGLMGWAVPHLEKLIVRETINPLAQSSHGALRVWSFSRCELIILLFPVTR
jgi:hypothetical protein